MNILEFAQETRDFARLGKLLNEEDIIYSPNTPVHLIHSLLLGLLDSNELNAVKILFQKAIENGVELPYPAIFLQRMEKECRHSLANELRQCWCNVYENKPKNSEWQLILLAKAKFDLGECSSALEIINKAATAHPMARLIAIESGRLHMLSGDNARALKEFLRARNLHPYIETWVWRAIALLETGSFAINGVLIGLPLGMTGPLMLMGMLQGGYEHSEREALLDNIQPYDRILELGAGVGYLACCATKAEPTITYLAVEANQRLESVIKNNFELNKSCARVISGASSLSNETIEFHIAKELWSSSTIPIQTTVDQIIVNRINANELIQELNPTILVIDIEGGEVDLFPGIDLTAVRCIIIELHNELVGTKKENDIVHTILDAGFNLDSQFTKNSVFVFKKYENVTELQ